MFHGLALEVRGGREVERSGRRDGPLAPGGDLLGTDAAQYEHHLQSLPPGECAEQAPQSLGLAGAGRPDDRHTRAAADRGEPFDRLQRGVIGVELEALAGVGGGEVLVAGALRHGIRGGAVDRVHARQRGVALGLARCAQRAAHAVPGDQFAAAHLGGGDVEVLV